MPCKARDLIRVLKHFDVEVCEAKGGGSHYKATKQGHRTYPLTLHNGLKSEISDVYIRGVCRAFSIDERALREKL